MNVKSYQDNKSYSAHYPPKYRKMVYLLAKFATQPHILI